MKRQFPEAGFHLSEVTLSISISKRRLSSDQMSKRLENGMGEALSLFKPGDKSANQTSTVLDAFRARTDFGIIPLNLAETPIRQECSWRFDHEQETGHYAGLRKFCPSQIIYDPFRSLNCISVPLFLPMDEVCSAPGTAVTCQVQTPVHETLGTGV
ncbi:unnamed protein product [Diplocarpon coronariae]